MAIIRNKNRYQLGGLRSRYQIGGIRKNPLHYYRRQAGGMYDDNTAASVGQGVPGTTSNIVFQEGDPKLQEARLQQTEDVIEQQQALGQETAAQSELIQEEGKITAEHEGLLAAQKVQDNIAATEGTVGLLGQAAGISPIAEKGSAVKGAMQAYKIQRSVNLAKKAKDLGELTVGGAKALEKSKALLQVGKAGTEGATTLATTGVEAGAKGSALAAGAKSFLSSGAGLGILASAAGYGVKKLWGDEDPTTATGGDIAGSALSGAGTGMAIGSIIPGIGTAVGGIVGGLYGIGKSVFGAKSAKRKQEKAERKAKREYKAKVAKKVTAHNKDLMKSYGASMAAQRAGALQQKTYSGYDLGQNVIAQMGGMRMGMPRYRHAA